MQLTFSIGGRADDFGQLLRPAGTGRSIDVVGSEIQRLAPAGTDGHDASQLGIGPNALGFVDGHRAGIVDEETAILVDVVLQFELSEVARRR